MPILSDFPAGGVGLNFKVVRVESEETYPATAAENTIGVVTSVDITGWAFRADEPTEPEEGMVWIFTGSLGSCNFNALKKNELYVYPLYAKQYVDDAWVDVIAKIYREGEWIDWIVWFFKQGEGMQLSFILKKQANASIAASDEYIQSKYMATYNSITNVETQVPIDVTGFSEIVAEITCTGINGTYYPTLYLSNTVCSSEGVAQDTIAYVKLMSASSNKVELKLPLDETTDGTHYVGIWGIANYTITNWYMR